MMKSALVVVGVLLSPYAAADEDAAAQIRERLADVRPDLPVETVVASPVPGLIEVRLSGGTTLHATADGRFLIVGDLYQIGPDELVNVTEIRRNEERHELLAAVDREDMVIFSPEGVTRAYINVFTDVDCGYCRRLHQEVPALNEMGIEVRYLAYPRAGVPSESYHKMVSAWCSDDPNDAITRLKRGEQVPARTCANPVARQFELGREAGVRGTPAIVLEDGRMLPGYMPAEEIAAVLGLGS